MSFLYFHNFTIKNERIFNYIVCQNHKSYFQIVFFCLRATLSYHGLTLSIPFATLSEAPFEAFASVRRSVRDSVHGLVCCLVRGSVRSSVLGSLRHHDVEGDTINVGGPRRDKTRSEKKIQKWILNCKSLRSELCISLTHPTILSNLSF